MRIADLFRRRRTLNRFPDVQPDRRDTLARALEATLSLATPPEMEAKVGQLERDIESYTGARYALGANSGTTALYLALKVLGVGSGDEVVTVANSWISTVTVIVETGATPVFADIDPRTGTMYPESLSTRIGRRTRAVLPVHMYGIPADMPRIMEIARAHGLRVIEDACQAIGARIDGRHVGTFGDIGCLSFHASKLVGSPADGGMLLTQDSSLRDALKAASLPDWSQACISPQPRVPSRLGPVQVPVLRHKLQRLPETMSEQAASYALWKQALAPTGGCRFLEPLAGHTESPRTCMVLPEDGDGLRRACAANGLAVHPLYADSVAFARAVSRDAAIPVTLDILERQFRLPTGQQVPAELVNRIGRTLAQTARAG
jgi:dTDP-4-amino-4,6-dideoxygalactose transaminase